MDIEQFKNLIGLDEFDDFDLQIQTALDYISTKHTEEETDYEDKILYGTLCFLEEINPELVGKVDSYKIGDLSVVVNAIGSMGTNLSFCKKYKLLKKSNTFESCSVARGGRN